MADAIADVTTSGEQQEEPREAPAEPLGRNRDFRVLLAGQGVSHFGDAITVTVLPLLVLALTGSGLAIGVVLAIQAVSDFLFSLPAGAIADRSDRKRMMIGADFGRAILTALIPISVMLGGPTVLVVVAVVAPLSILRALFRAAVIASIPSIVGRSNLGRANALLEMILSIAFIVGPALAGVLSTYIGPGPTLAIDAASFAVSALAILAIRRDLVAPSDRPPARIVDDVREGIGFIVHHPLLRAAILLFATYTTITTTMVPALAVKMTRDLGAAESTFGLAVSALGVGSLVGAIVATRLGARTNVALVLLASTFAAGLTLLGVAVAGAVAVILALTAFLGLIETVIVVTYVTLRTAHSPDALLGRIGSTARVVSLGLQPIGMIVGGILIDAIGGTQTIAVMGAGLCLLTLAFAPVRPLRTATLTPQRL